MFKKEHSALLKFYGISPIHAGSGSSTDVVDLPIQRERHTNYPHIQASAVKGAMRAHFRMVSGTDNINFIFGSDTSDEWKDKDSLAGAVSISDAKIAAFPVRSNVSPFVWVTCPAVIKRINNDMGLIGRNAIETENNSLDEDSAICLKGSLKRKILLEDAVVEANGSVNITHEIFSDCDNLLLISDDMFKYCVENCTEIQTQIKIDPEKGTAKDTGLRYQELLPADTVLYSTIFYCDSLDNEKSLQAVGIIELLKESIKGSMQLGGDCTLGRGICKIEWIGGEQ